MKYALWAAIAGVGLVGVVTLIGWMLPVGHVASRSVSVRASPESVFDLLRDVEGYPAWRPDVSKIDILEDRQTAVRFREHSRTGTLVLEIIEASRPTRIVTRIADDSQPFGGTWTFEVAPIRDGAAVTITERGEVYNPVFRFVARFILGHDRTIDGFLNALQRRLESVPAV